MKFDHDGVSSRGGPRLLARLALLAATLVWGASFVIVQRALADMPVFHLLAFRFLLATLLLLPLARGPRTPGLFRDGLFLGLALFTGFAFQSFGLLGTTPSRSAFLTGLSVVLVPLFGLALGRRLRPGPAAGTLVAAAGLWVLYRPQGGAAAPFGWGDGLTIGCAVAFAVYVLLAEAAVRRHRLRSIAVAQFGTIAALSLPSLVLQPPVRSELTRYSVFAVLVMGIVATAGAFACQLYAQRHLTAIETGVILTLEPVIAAAVSVALGVERWTSQLTWGGALVVAAMLITEIRGGPGDVPPAVAATPRT